MFWPPPPGKLGLEVSGWVVRHLRSVEPQLGVCEGFLAERRLLGLMVSNISLRLQIYLSGGAMFMGGMLSMQPLMTCCECFG